MEEVSEFLSFRTYMEGGKQVSTQVRNVGQLKEKQTGAMTFELVTLAPAPGPSSPHATTPHDHVPDEFSSHNISPLPR